MSHLGSGSNIIALDVMGSDKGPRVVIDGALSALDLLKDLDSLILVGDENAIVPYLKEKGVVNHSKLSLYHAPEVIGMHEKPIQSLKQKKNASMLQAIELVKAEKAQAVVSCGNTGSLMAGGLLKLRPISGIERPALATIIPGPKSHFVLIDSGANPSPSTEQMVDNAILGKNFSRIILNCPNPRIGLLTTGTEEGKGNELIQKTHEQLKQIAHVIQYTGLIEGFHLFGDQVDVVVCDGFVGNILLKSSESLFLFLRDCLKQELTSTFIRKLGAFLSRGAFVKLKNHLSPDQYGGAPFLGLSSPVIKAHGSSNSKAIMNAIRIAHLMVRHDIKASIQKDLGSLNAIS